MMMFRMTLCDHKAAEQAVQLSEKKYCSAIASLNASFESTYRIVDSDWNKHVSFIGQIL